MTEIILGLKEGDVVSFILMFMIGYHKGFVPTANQVEVEAHGNNASRVGIQVYPSLATMAILKR